ncbi:MAG: hypothetical protein K5851_08195 [Lachnospiraceae bacterium]|nr:hypothetical protein [Lachnospiraceae bacterium]
MDSIIKAFSGIFICFFTLMIGIGIVSSTMNTGKAQRFAADCAVRIGNSNFDRGVIDACKKDASKFGYKIDIDLVKEEETEHIDYGCLKLFYNIWIPIINVKQEHMVEADVL